MEQKEMFYYEGRPITELDKEELLVALRELYHRLRDTQDTLSKYVIWQGMTKQEKIREG